MKKITKKSVNLCLEILTFRFLMILSLLYHIKNNINQNLIQQMHQYILFIVKQN